MWLRRVAVLLVLVLAGVACRRDPQVVKRNYVENGNRYFDRGKYKEAAIMYRRAIQKDAMYAEAYYRLGMTDLRLNRPQEAARNFRRAVDVQPGHVEAKAQLGDLYLAFYLMDQKHNDNLGPEIDKISKLLLDRDPKSASGLRLKGYMLLAKEKDAKAAVEAFRKANEYSPMKKEIVLPLAQSLIADNQFPEAEALLKALIDKQQDFGGSYDMLYLQYMRLNRQAEADEIIRRKVDRNPKVAEYRLQLALHYFGTQRRAEMQSTLAALAGDRKQFPDGRRRVGNFYFSIRDYDSAIQQYETGLKDDPENKAAYQKSIAEVLLAQGKRQEAQRLLEEVRKEFPKDESARAMWASLLVDSGDPQQLQTAVTELQAALGRSPNNPVLRYNLARALLVTRQPEQARAQLQEAIKLQSNYVPPRLLLAQMQLARAEFGNALQQAQEILRDEPSNLAGKLIRTTALAGMGNRDQSRNELNAMLKEHPNSKEVVLQLALLDLGEKRFRDAEAAFSKLHDQDPGDLRGVMGLSEAYALQAQFDKAIDLIKSELAKAPQRRQLRLALGNLGVQSGRYDLAVEQYETLVQQDPKAGDVYLRLGETYRRKGDSAAAIRNFEKAKELRPNDPKAYLQLALLLDGDGRKGEARPIYQQILKLQPDNPVALNNLAYMLAESGGDLDQALAMALRAKQRWPNDENVADTLGWIYIKKNLSDNAVQIFRELINKSPNMSTFRYHLAMALYQKGDKSAARKELQIALTKRPPKDEEAKIKEMLGRL